jgi:hypothetical protein
MGDSIFYTGVKQEIRNLINSRGAAYAKDVRDSNSLRWLSTKQVFASATANHKVSKRSASLGIPTGGGIGNNGLYSTDSQADDGDRRILPKAHITSIKIANIGDWGSVKKVDLSFTCYSLNQLNQNLAFCDIGADITIRYGWKNGGDGYNGPIGTFEGQIYNFNYSVNSTGGWDCTTSAMAKGIDVVSGNIKGGKPAGNVLDGSGLTIPKFDILSRVKGFMLLISDLTNGQTKQLLPNLLYGCLEYASDWGAGTTSPENSNVPADAEPKQAEKHYYITLESLCGQLTDILFTQAKTGATLTCNSTVTLSPGLEDPMWLISANPKQVVFPGFNKYGDKHDFNFTGQVTMALGEVLDSSKIMLSVDWLNSLLPNLGDKEDASKAGDTSISAFLGKVFDSIHQNSGRRISLTLANEPKDTTGKKWLVVDANYKGNTAVEIFSIKAFSKDSVVRNITINSKVPSEMATAAFVAPGAASGYPAGTKYIQQIMKGDPDLSLFGATVTALENIKKAFDATEPPVKPKEGEPNNAGPTDANVSTLQSILASLHNFNPNGSEKQIMYPLGFSATIDGVDGIVFGNTVTTNYLPKQYYDKKGSKVVFTVTNVSHDISISDWTTTIETVCRLPA